MNTYSRLTRTSYDRFQIMEVLGLLTAMILIISRRTAFGNSVIMQAQTLSNNEWNPQFCIHEFERRSLL